MSFLPLLRDSFFDGDASHGTDAGEGVPELGAHDARSEEQVVELCPGGVEHRERTTDVAGAVLFQDCFYFGRFGGVIESLNAIGQVDSLVQKRPNAGFDGVEHGVESTPEHDRGDRVPCVDLDHELVRQRSSQDVEVDGVQGRQIFELVVVHARAQSGHALERVVERIGRGVQMFEHRGDGATSAFEFDEDDVFEFHVGEFESRTCDTQIARHPGRIGQVGPTGLMVLSTHGFFLHFEYPKLLSGEVKKAGSGLYL